MYGNIEIGFELKSCDEMCVSPQLFLLLFCYRIARFDADIPLYPTAEHALVTFYKNFSSFSVHKNKKILKSQGVNAKKCKKIYFDVL